MLKVTGLFLHDVVERNVEHLIQITICWVARRTRENNSRVPSNMG